MAVNSEKKQIKVTGMSCNHCVAAVEKAVSGVKGVSSVKVDLPSSTANVEYDPKQTDLDEIKSAIKNSGYGTVS